MMLRRRSTPSATPTPADDIRGTDVQDESDADDLQRAHETAPLLLRAAAMYCGVSPLSPNVWVLAVSHLCTVIYACAFWIQQPLLVFVSERMGSTEAFVWSETVFSALQLVGAPLMGRLADVMSPRATMTVAQLAGTASYLLLFAATSSAGIVLSKLPGTLMHGMMAAQALISQSSAKADRAAALGRISLSYGVGMVAGSAASGFLVSLLGGEGPGTRRVAVVSAALSFLTVPLLMVFVPTTSMRARKASRSSEEEEEAKESDEGGALSAVVRLLSLPGLRTLFTVMFAVGLPMSVQKTLFTVNASSRFAFTEGTMGLTQTVGALVALVSNVVLIGPLTATFSERSLFVASILTLSATVVTYALASTPTHVLLLLVPLSAASTVLYTLLTASISKYAPAGDAGAAIGLSHGARSLIGVVGPALTGVLVPRMTYLALLLLSAGGLVSAAAVAALLPPQKG